MTALLTALLTTAVLGAGAAYLAGGFFVDFALRRGTAGNPSAPPAAFRSAIEGSGQAIRPAPRPRAPGEDWTLRAFDGLALRATHFAPEDAVTRGTFVTFLARLYRIHNDTAVIDGDSVFADLPEDAWYSAPARWAASWGIIFGDGALFHPEDPLTRESMVTMLYRYAAAQGMNVSSLDDLTVYPDFAQISVWALPAMRWAAGLRLLGSGGGPLEPGRTATRAEVVGMLIAFMDAYGL